MAVYREGYDIVQQYEKQKQQIWNDACDEGIICEVGDRNWDNVVQLVEWYGKPQKEKCTDRESVAEVKLLNEWAYSDDRADGRLKPESEYEDRFEVHYYKFRANDKHSLIYSNKKQAHGFYSITKIQ